MTIGLPGVECDGRRQTFKTVVNQHPVRKHMRLPEVIHALFFRVA
jgi:hypothetical protein